MAIRRTLRRDDFHLARRVGAALRTQEYRRPVEIAAEPVEVGGADGEIERMDIRHDGQRTCARGCSPKVLGFLDDRHGLAMRFGAHAHELLCEFANQVAARNPRREPESLSGGVRFDDRAMNFEQVSVRVAQDDAITGGVLHLDQILPERGALFAAQTSLVDRRKMRQAGRRLSTRERRA
jgi:hypothetical protein